MSQVGAGPAARAAIALPREMGRGGAELVPMLAGVPLFRNLSRRHLKRVASLARMRRFFLDTLVAGQMAADGSFPRELARTKPYGYSLFQLDVMATIRLARPASSPRATC